MLNRFFKEQDGQDMVEYALLAALVGLATVVALGQFAGSIGAIWSSISNQLTS